MTPREVERRVGVEEPRAEIHEMHEEMKQVLERQLLSMQVEIQQIKLDAAKAATHSNGKKAWYNYIGVPGAILAVATILLLYHQNFAMPAVRTAAREAFEVMLKEPQFWALVKEVAREEAEKAASINDSAQDRAIEDIRTRLSEDEKTINENTRYLDSTGRRRAVAPKE